MTQQEAINILDRRTTIPGDGFTWEQINEAIDMAISALRPISRKQVEKVWRGCKYCDEEWGTCDPITNRFTMPPRGGIRFCPMCGRPLTDEAVQMVMERLEVLRGETETD